MKTKKTYKLKRVAHKEMKWRILEKSAELFRKYGYQDTTMDRIAESVQISKVRIYRYWDSKEEILYETVRIVHNDLISSLASITESNEPPDDKLRKAIADHASIFYSALSPFYHGVFNPDTLITTNHRRTIIKLRDKYDSLLRQIIDEGINRGIFIECHPNLISFAILGAANYVRAWYSRDGPLTFEEVTTYIADYLVNGILVQERRKLQLD